MNKYNLSEDETIDDVNDDKYTDEYDIHSKIDKIIDFKRLDETNPLERAKKYAYIKENPVEPGFMKIDLFEGHDEHGNPIVKSVSEKGSFSEDPFFTVDPYMLFQANINACPSNVVPMLIEQAKQSVREEGKIFRKEKRDKEFPWGWIIIGLSLIPGLLLLISWIF